MKKLFFILFILPAWCLAQTNITPQFKRNIPADSLLGYSIPGLTGNHWLPDTSWVKKYTGSSFALSNPSGLLTFTASNGTATNGLRTDGLHGIDSTVVRSVANSYSLAAMATKLASYVPTSRQILNGWGILGGGNLTTDRTLSTDTSSGKLATQYYASVVVGPDGIVLGMSPTTISGTTATTPSGTYRLNNLLVVKGSSTNTTIDSQDASLNRYDLIVGDASGVLSKVSGVLGADAVQPDVPANKALIASIYIPSVASGGTVNSGNGNGKGTTSNALNGGYGIIPFSFNGSTSGVKVVTDTGKMQTVANFFPKGDTRYYKSSNPSGYISGNQTISFAPTGDVTGSTTGTTTLAPALSIGAGKVVNSMIASATIDPTTKLSATGTPSSTTYLRGDNTWATVSGGVTSVSNSDGTLTISPTTGAVAGSLNLAHANTWTALQTHQFNNIITTPTNGLELINSTVSTSGVPNQYAPADHWQAHVWNISGTPADNYTDWQQYVSTQSAATPKSTMIWRSSVTNTSTPIYSTAMSLSSDGNLTTGANATVGLNLFVQNAINGIGYNLYSPFANDAGSISNSGYLFGGASQISTRLGIFGNNNTTLAANNNYASLVVGNNIFTMAASGTHPWAVNEAITPLGTITTNGSTTITNTASLYIGGASSAGANNYAMYVAGGNVSMPSSNVSANNFLFNGQSIATAGATTTLTVSSPYQTIFTGTSNQNLTMPVASTLPQYWSCSVINNSTGTITVQSSGGNTIQTLAAGVSGTFICITTSGTSAASWTVGGTAQYLPLAGGAMTGAISSSNGTAISSYNGLSGGSSKAAYIGFNPVGVGLPCVYISSGATYSEFRANGMIFNDGTNQLGINTPSLSTNRTISYPDASGTLALTSQINITWGEVIGGSQIMTPGNGWVATGNGGALYTFVLPSTCAVGQLIAVAGSGSGGWKITQNAGQNLIVAGASSTVGTGGFVASSNRYDSVQFICTVANTTWVCINHEGTLTVN